MSAETLMLAVAAVVIAGYIAAIAKGWMPPPNEHNMGIWF